MPAWKSKLESSLSDSLCSTRSCGIQPQRFPAEERAGMASVANDVGELGEKKIGSWPTTTEVLAQSMRMVAVRKRTSPELTPFGTDAKPPPRSSCKSAFVLAPATVGPKASKPISDWRRVAPKLPPESPGGFAYARVGRSTLSTTP